MGAKEGRGGNVGAGAPSSVGLGVGRGLVVGSFESVALRRPSKTEVGDRVGEVVGGIVTTLKGEGVGAGVGSFESLKASASLSNVVRSKTAFDSLVRHM